jgi:hypothetical protein
MLMQPSPMAEISIPELPSFRVFMFSSSTSA